VRVNSELPVDHYSAHSAADFLHATDLCQRPYLTGVNFSVSSGVGFLALLEVSIQTGIIMVEYINQMRARDTSPASDHDDDVSGDTRPAPCRNFSRDRIGFAAPVRDCDPGRLARRAAHEYLLAADTLRMDRRLEVDFVETD
jgi:hypothetical protein